MNWLERTFRFLEMEYQLFVFSIFWILPLFTATLSMEIEIYWKLCVPGIVYLLSIYCKWFLQKNLSLSSDYWSWSSIMQPLPLLSNVSKNSPKGVGKPMNSKKYGQVLNEGFIQKIYNKVVEIVYAVKNIFGYGAVATKAAVSYHTTSATTTVIVNDCDESDDTCPETANDLIRAISTQLTGSHVTSNVFMETADCLVTPALSFVETDCHIVPGSSSMETDYHIILGISSPETTDCHIVPETSSTEFNCRIPSEASSAKTTASHIVQRTSISENTDCHIVLGSPSKESDYHIVPETPSTETTDCNIVPGTPSTETNDCHIVLGPSSTETTDYQIMPGTSFTENTDYHLKLESLSTETDYSLVPGKSSSETEFNPFAFCGASNDITDVHGESGGTTAETTVVHIESDETFEETRNCDIPSVASISEEETIPPELEISGNVQSLMERLMDSECKEIDDSCAEQIKEHRRIKPTRKYANSNLEGQSFSFVSDDAATNTTDGQVAFVRTSTETAYDLISSQATSVYRDFVEHCNVFKDTPDNFDVTKVKSLSETENTEPELDISDMAHSLMKMLMDSVREEAESSFTEPIKNRRRINPTKKCVHEGSINSIPLEFIYPCL